VELGRQPVALAVGLAVASVLSLSLSMTVLSLVRRRRHEFALLKALGMERGQIRAGAVVLVMVVVGNLLTSLPATLAARTRAALILKSE